MEHAATQKSLRQQARIMAVTKGVSMELVLSVLKEKRITLIGESRWQEAKGKLAQYPQHIEKHFIGHLQTNKVQEIVQHFDCVESVDSIKLAMALNKECEKQDKQLPVFIQVNISNDPSKFGFTTEELPAAMKAIRLLPNLSVYGLMTITAGGQTPEQTRANFKHMKLLQEKYQLPELSMGMSEDWRIATEEGATIVRLGRVLFSQRN